MNNSTVEKHLRCSIDRASELNQIISPLFEKSLVKYFSYNRYLRNQRWIGLYTDPDPVRIALSKGLGPIFVDKDGVAIDSGVYFHNDLKDIVKTTVSNQQVDAFFSQNDNPKGKRVVENGLLIIRRGQSYDESFYFSLYTDETISSRAYYHHVLNNIKSFCLYFLRHGKQLIREAEKNIILYQIPETGADDFFKMFFCHESLPAGQSWFLNKSFCFETPYGEAYLSRQELNCLRLLAHNHSYKEIADELDLQYKTVESYVQNIKNKLSADSKIELTRYYERFAVLDFDKKSEPR